MDLEKVSRSCRPIKKGGSLGNAIGRKKGILETGAR